MWDQGKFLKSVFVLVETKCENKQKNFNSRIGDRDAITRWKIKEDGAYDRPSLEIIQRIVDEFNCSFDWLLAGEEKTKDFSSQEASPPSQSINLISKLIDQLDKRLEEQGKRLDEQGKRIDSVIELTKQQAPRDVKIAQGE